MIPSPPWGRSRGRVPGQNTLRYLQLLRRGPRPARAGDLSPPRGEGIKGKGLPFDSTTMLLNFALAGALDDGDDEETTETTMETTRRRWRRRLEGRSPSHTPTGSADYPFRQKEKRKPFSFSRSKLMETVIKTSLLFPGPTKPGGRSVTGR